MGIRFYCPNGHKLNVKSFLAGKRGICPHCGVRFEIPQQSVATNKIPTAVPEAPLAETIEDPFADLAPVGAGDARHVAPVQLGPAGVPAHAAAPSRGAQIPLSVGGAVSPTTNPGVQQPFVVPSPQSIAPQPFAPPKPAGAPPSSAPIDPIAEAPNAVWYVRPNSGGQFGPAPGEVFRQWLDQKRVGPDSMVWREGWADWRPAAVVFPQLTPVSRAPVALPPQNAAPLPTRPSVSPQATDDWTDAIIDTKPIQHRHRSSSQQSNVILGISVAIILLGAVLAFVLIRMAMKQPREGDSLNTKPLLRAGAAQA